MSLSAQLARLRAELEFARSLDWEVPPPPEEPPGFNTTRLHPLAQSQYGSAAGELTREEMRAGLRDRVHDFALDTSARGLLIVNVPAGVGKTYATSQAVQGAARAGQRVLWCAQDHRAWDDLTAFPHFAPDQWQHWLGMGKEIPGAAGERMCREADAMSRWLHLGYQARDLCTRLCLRQGWMEAGCPYWQQVRDTSAPITFGMHAHLVYGLPGRSYDLAVVDELPMRAFVKERLIPWRTGIMRLAGRLPRYGGLGPGGALITVLAQYIAFRASAGAETLGGRALFDVIGPYLGDCYAAVEAGLWQEATPPSFSRAEEIAEVDWAFLPDLLTAAAVGYEAWRAGWPRWAQRVWASSQGLHLLGRHGIWDELPQRVIVLDATGAPNDYRLMFRQQHITAAGNIRWEQRRAREVYAPRAKRAGKLYQVTGRLYSKRALYKVIKTARLRDEYGKETKHQEIAPLPAFTELVRTIAALAVKHGATRIGVITYQAIEVMLAAALVALGLTVATRHFYNVRGTNSLEDVEMLFVVGSPTPPPAEIIKLATALNPARRLPFIEFDSEGRALAVYLNQETEYRLTADGLAAAIQELGFDPATTRGIAKPIGVYTDPVLRAVHEQYRAAEVLQAAHRGRVNIQDIPVYILTSTPLLSEPLDGIYNDPPIAPGKINWRRWLSLLGWLEAQAEGTVVGVAELALAAGVVYNTASEWQLFEAARDYYAGRGWEVYKQPGQRGRPKQLLVKVRE